MLHILRHILGLRFSPVAAHRRAGIEFTVDVESRCFEVIPEQRTFDVEPESRRFDVPFEERHVFL